MLHRLDLHGPHLRLPRPLDAAGEWWSRRPPRLRMVIAGLLLVALGVAVDARIRAVESRWGGPLQKVAVAAVDLKVGDDPHRVRFVRLPPSAVPPGAVGVPPDGAVLSLPLTRGSVLTSKHLDARGPAVGLPRTMRAVPVPTEAGWDVRQGGWVDVWTLGSGDEPAQLVAAQRPVLQVRSDATGLTSLIGLKTDEVEAVSAGLALGRVMLAHAPAPTTDSMPAAGPG
ncbi:MAG: hypothetical protein GEU74_12615 [Nitriliruptorales bacterium]|nr:hypothetical protein [Nitriliruptorales bacterium]